MASDNRANFAVIGFTVLAGIAAVAGALVYLGGMRGRGNELLVETYYDRPVNGLSAGSDVNFRGVKIGKVRQISFVGCMYDNVEPKDAVKIYIRMALDPAMMGFDKVSADEARATLDMMVKKGVRVTVAASGITGMSRIEFDLPSPAVDASEPAFVPPWRPVCSYVPSRISLLDSFSDSATKVMNQINRMDMVSVWSNIHASVESLAQLAHTSETMLASRQDEVEQILGNLLSTSESVKELVDELKRNPSLLLRDSKYEPLPETE